MTRWFRDLRYQVFYRLFLRKGYPLEARGNRETGCEWYFSPAGLNGQSIIYSAGVGRDITFEHALVHRFGCSVTLLDPSPTGRATMELAENQIPQFKFHAVALAGKSGMLKLAPPQNPAEGSWYMQGDRTDLIEVPSVDLATLMKRANHRHIDLLKLDIEGAEYEVLDSLLRSRLPVGQLLVEFHHGTLPGIRRSQTIRAILRLLAAGFRLIKQDGLNHTFISAKPRPR